MASIAWGMLVSANLRGIPCWNNLPLFSVALDKPFLAAVLECWEKEGWLEREESHRRCRNSLAARPQRRRLETRTRCCCCNVAQKVSQANARNQAFKAFIRDVMPTLSSENPCKAAPTRESSLTKSPLKTLFMSIFAAIQSMKVRPRRRLLFRSPGLSKASSRQRLHGGTERNPGFLGVALDKSRSEAPENALDSDQLPDTSSGGSVCTDA